MLLNNALEMSHSTKAAVVVVVVLILEVSSSRGRT
jgi:hypothetical protein